MLAEAGGTQGLGGTCVNVGCIPKKLYSYAAHFAESFEESHGFGWEGEAPRLNWDTLKANRRREIARLNGVYSQLLLGAGVKLINGHARLVDAHTVEVDVAQDGRIESQRVTAKDILIATGGTPHLPQIVGGEYVLTSNDMFDLDPFPARLLVVGGGYIACEFASIFNGLGSHVTQIYRGEQVLRGFDDDVRHFIASEMRKAGIDLRLGCEATVEDLRSFDAVVIATGVLPRDPGIPGQDGPNVLNYSDVLRGAPVGRRVAVVGAGGIGFDVAEVLVHQGDSPTLNPPLWRREWGVGDPATTPGGLVAGGPQPERPAREVVLLQRKAEKPGRRLGKTTGWIHRASLQAKGVKMLGGVAYSRIVPEGLEVIEDGAPRLMPADTVVLCAGQVPRRALAEALTAAGIAHHVIGGADVAAELDAKRAIDQGARLAARL